MVLLLLLLEVGVTDWLDPWIIEQIHPVHWVVLFICKHVICRIRSIHSLISFTLSIRDIHPIHPLAGIFSSSSSLSLCIRPGNQLLSGKSQLFARPIELQRVYCLCTISISLSFSRQINYLLVFRFSQSEAIDNLFPKELLKQKGKKKDEEKNMEILSNW